MDLAHTKVVIDGYLEFSKDRRSRVFLELELTTSRVGILYYPGSIETHTDFLTFAAYGNPNIL
jgi:hypothetical protein